MLVSFPEFRKIHIDDRDAVEQITCLFEPYSDFNFTSLWSWDTTGDLELSFLNENLVVKMPDYVYETRQTLSFIGKTQIDNTAEILLEYCKDNKLDTALHLIPQELARKLINKPQFTVKEDPHNFDYVLSVKECVNLAGSRFKKKRKLINGFEAAHPGFITKLLDLADSKVHRQILNLTHEWYTKNNMKDLNHNEKIAIERALDSAKDLNLIGLGCYINNKLVGYSILEVINKEYGISHFQKADTHYRGIYAFLNQLEAKYLYERGCTLFNIEQDLGVPGLKISKEAWRPIKYLKKYSVALKLS